jgi:hypothetical protein
MAERFCECGDPIATGRTGKATRCAACSLAASSASTSNGLLYRGKRIVPVSCWCQRTTVWVSHDDNLRGLTGSCGLSTCTQHLVVA